MRVPFHAYARESFRSYQILSPSPFCSPPFPSFLLPTFEQTETRRETRITRSHNILLFLFSDRAVFWKRKVETKISRNDSKIVILNVIGETNRSTLFFLFGFIWIIKMFKYFFGILIEFLEWFDNFYDFVKSCKIFGNLKL